jgi:hypothetical protein
MLGLRTRRQEQPSGNRTATEQQGSGELFVADVRGRAAIEVHCGSRGDPAVDGDGGQVQTAGGPAVGQNSRHVNGRAEFVRLGLDRRAVNGGQNRSRRVQLELSTMGRLRSSAASFPYAAVESLVALIEGGTPPAPAEVRTAHTLVPRESTLGRGRGE